MACSKAYPLFQILIWEKGGVGSHYETEFTFTIIGVTIFGP